MKKLLSGMMFLMLMCSSANAQVTFTCTGGMKFNDGEGVQKMFDGNINTKFTGNTGNDCYALFTASTPIYVWGYEMTTGNDTGAYGRLLRKWKLYGTNDETVAADASSAAWTLIDEVTENNSYVQQVNFYKQRFFCQTSATGTAYKYFKLLLTDGGFVQLSEFSLCYETYQVVNYEWFESDGGDGSKKAVDGKLNQKWEGQTALVGKHLTVKTSDGQPHSVKSYSFTTHDDYDWSNRAPKEWRIEGSNDNSSWVTIAEVTGGNPIKNANYTTYEFVPDNTSDAFTYVKLTLTSMKGNGYQQLGEFHVVGGCTTHTWQSEGAVAATCTSRGGDEYVCTICGTKKLENATGKAAHNYEDGICSACGDYQRDYLTKNGNYFEPATAAHFTWLATMMNETESGSFNIRLTQDVDLTGFRGFGYGDRALPFRGEFDGQGHWMDNFSLTGIMDKNVALFGKTNGANIHDLGLGKANVRTGWGTQNTGIIAGNADNTTFNRIAVMNGSYVEGYDHVGTIAGNTQGNTTVSNCISDAEVYSMQYQAGGFVGTARKVTLQKNLFLGDVKCGGGVGNVGGLVSLWEYDDEKVLKNNVMAAKAITTANTSITPLVSTNGKSASYENNYVASSTIFKSTSGDADADLKAGKTMTFDDISGSNGKTVADDKMKGADFYSSTMNWDMTNDWYFIAEGQYPVLKWMVDEISNASELTAFSAKVNEGYLSPVALLTANITADASFASIGTTDNKFSGTFDGQGHVVTLNISSDQEFQGLIGCATGNTTIKNVITKGSVNGSARCGGILGGSQGSGAISILNCGNEASITATNQNAGGIHGCNNGSAATYTLTNCYNAGTVKGGNESAGISGWLGKKATVTNCYNIGEVTGVDGTKTFARWESGTYINCYNSLSANEVAGRTDSYPMDKVRSGELCVALGSAFTQDLSQEGHPTFESKNVIAGKWFNDAENDVYYNKEGDSYTVYQLNLDETKTKFDVPANVTAKNISVGRTITAGKWIGLCLPFDYDIPSGWDVRELTSVNGSGENASMMFSVASSIEAGKPYIVKTDADVTAIAATDKTFATTTEDIAFGGVTMKGNLGQTSIPQGSFYISNQGTLKKLTAETATLKGFRAYFTVGGGSGVKALSFDLDDDATAIEMVDAQQSTANDQTIYNVAGQRMSKVQKGINIINGKKILK